MRAPRNVDGVEWAVAAPLRATTARRRATRIRALVLSAAVCAFASAASAQFGASGGIAPYTFLPPEAAVAGMAAGTANSVNQSQRCYWQRGGRSAPQEHCEDQTPAQPTK